MGGAGGCGQQEGMARRPRRRVGLEGSDPEGQ